MTWYADEIILWASAAAVDAVGDSPHSRHFAYHIRSLNEHDWHNQEQKHGLPDEGLLVVRPVCGSSSHGSEWHGVATLDWTELPPESQSERLLDATMTQQLAEYLDDESRPPLQLRKAIASLAKSLDQPVMHYRCGMFGGFIDCEYSLIYEPTESVFLTKSSLQSESPVTEDSLRAGLAKVGVDLPIAYFASHTRSFLW